MNTPPTWQSWLTAAQVAQLFTAVGKPVTDRHVRRWFSEVEPADVRMRGNVREVRLSALRSRMQRDMVEVLDMDTEEADDIPEAPLAPKDPADIDGHFEPDTTDMDTDMVLYEEPTFPSWERARDIPDLPDMSPITLPVNLAELFPVEPSPAYCRDWRRDRWTAFIQAVVWCVVMAVRVLAMLLNAVIWVAERMFCGHALQPDAEIYEERWQTCSTHPNVFTRRRQ